LLCLALPPLVVSCRHWTLDTGTGNDLAFAYNVTGWVYFVTCSTSDEHWRRHLFASGSPSENLFMTCSTSDEYWRQHLFASSPSSENLFMTCSTSDEYWRRHLFASGSLSENPFVTCSTSDEHWRRHLLLSRRRLCNNASTNTKIRYHSSHRTTLNLGIC